MLSSSSPDVSSDSVHTEACLTVLRSLEVVNLALGVSLGPSDTCLGAGFNLGRRGAGISLEVDGSDIAFLGPRGL